jgi:hypothetical protein
VTDTSVCGGALRFECTTAADECLADADCAGLGAGFACGWDGARRVCLANNCIE